MMLTRLGAAVPSRNSRSSRSPFAALRVGHRRLGSLGGQDRLLVAQRVARIVCELGVIQLRRARGVDVKIRSVMIREAFVRLGPAFVKIGQALSTRRDVLPPELCVELSRLQDEMPFVDNVLAMAVIEKSLGKPAHVLFEGLDVTTEPVAAASLGQVYRARIRGSGELVAVKVQRPNVSEIVALDSVALRFVARAAGWFWGTATNMELVTDEVVGRIVDEMDYRREATDAERFARLYADKTGEEAIVVPKVYRELSSAKVLTLEWIEGQKLVAWTDANGPEAARKMVERGVRCTVAQFFDHGFFHADPHPGNLMVTQDDSLAYLDFGKMGEISSEDRVALMTLLVHFVNRDAVGLARDFTNLGFVENRSGDTGSQRVLVEALERTLAKTRKKGLGEDRLTLQGVFAELRLTLPNGRGDALSFRLPPRFATIARALGALEGAVLAADPSFKVVGAAYPHVARALVVDRGAETRRALRELLVDINGKVRWARLDALVGVIPEESASTTSESSQASFLIKTVTLLGPLASANAVRDALDFVASPAGFRTRRALLDDADGAITEALNRGGSEAEAKKLAGLSVEVLRLVAQHPEHWLPLLADYAGSPVAVQTLAALGNRVATRNGWRIPAAALKLASTFLHATHSFKTPGAPKEEDEEAHSSSPPLLLKAAALPRDSVSGPHPQKLNSSKQKI